MIERMEWDTAEIPLTTDELNAMLTREYAPTEAEPLPFCTDDAAAVRLMAACAEKFKSFELYRGCDSGDWIATIDKDYEGQADTIPLAVAKAAYFIKEYVYEPTAVTVLSGKPLSDFIVEF